MNKFQENLRFYRSNLGLTGKDFAASVNIPYTKYIAYENKGAWPNEENLVKIAAALHVSIDELLGYKPDLLSFHLAHGLIPGVMYPAKVGDTVSITSPTGKTIKEMSVPKYITVMEHIEREVEENLLDIKANIRELLVIKYFLEAEKWDCIYRDEQENP